MDKGLVGGSSMLLVLSLLTEKDMYGYEMIVNLRGKSNNVFELKAGSLYPLLHSLEEKHFVTSYEDDSTGKMSKYYHLSAEGKRFLKEKKEEWEIYSAAVSSVLTFAW